jgi:hypothetical protein
MSQHSDAETRAQIHNGMLHNGTLHNGALQNVTLQNDTLHNSTLQNSTALQNNTDTKWYIVLKWYMLQNNLLQNVQLRRYITKQNTNIMVGYKIAHYSHKQQGSTNPRIYWA